MKPAQKLVTLSSLLVLALVLALVMLLPAQNQLGASNDSESGVVLSQCTPCHSNLDAFKNPRIIFSHAVHFERGIKCNKCHVEYPHKPTETLRVEKYLCYNCHGLNHSRQGLVAGGDCGLCHPQSFELVPKDHSVLWRTSLHKWVPLLDLKECVLCHKPQFCERCHASQGIKPLDPQAYLYEGRLPVSSTDKLLLDRSIPVVMSKCQSCHSNLEAFKVPGLIFTHGTHFERGIKCASCHREFPHSQEGSARVGMDNCYGCHSLRHAERGLIAGEECSLCHTPDFDLRPPNHTSGFVAGTHRELASQDRLNCMMCHKEEFCSQCHTDRKIVPPNHVANRNTEKSWGKVHGVNLQPQECSHCHEQKFCARCHKIAMPHSVFWLAQHKGSPMEEKSDCKVCHQGKTYCSDCHHRLPQTTILTLKNCVRCHNELQRRILELVAQRRRGLAVHRAHFDMAHTKPFECSTCHAQLFKKEAKAFTEKRPYRFELCSSCHGRRRGNKLVAPWGGSQLCRRCHPNTD